MAGSLAHDSLFEVRLGRLICRLVLSAISVPATRIHSASYGLRQIHNHHVIPTTVPTPTSHSSAQSAPIFKVFSETFSVLFGRRPRAFSHFLFPLQHNSLRDAEGKAHSFSAQNILRDELVNCEFCLLKSINLCRKLVMQSLQIFWGESDVALFQMQDIG